jgi:hypothetical protein
LPLALKQETFRCIFAPDGMTVLNGNWLRRGGDLTTKAGRRPALIVIAVVLGSIRLR